MAKHYLKHQDRELEADVREGVDGFEIVLEGQSFSGTLQRLGQTPRYLMRVGETLFDVLATETKQGFRIQIGGVDYEIETSKPTRARSRKEDSSDFMENGRWVLQSPLTGAVVETRVEVGASVEPGNVLMVVEAMKMQNELRSRVRGRVASVLVSQGQRVETGMRLIEVEAAAEPDAESSS